MSNLENNEKILKIFSNIRCLNRDQLPRYLDGRLTDVEKHLVEQHLVDCDLCFDALQVLQQQQHREKYLPMSAGMLQFIRNSIKKVSHVHKAERYHRQEQKRESFLIYFWGVATILIIAGGIYLVQQQSKYKATAMPRQLAQGDGPTVPSASTETIPVQAAVVTPVPPAKHDSTVAQPKTEAPPPVPVPAAQKPAPKKDSVKTTPAKPAALVTKDSMKQPPAAKPVETKVAPAAPVQKDTPAAITKPAPKTEVATKKAADDEKEKPAPKPATTDINSTDEFLYKAAMVYHQQGDLNEAISRYKHLSGSPGRYGELSRYQLAVCYRSKGQTGKARRMFKEVVRMNGTMKEKAQQALDNL